MKSLILSVLLATSVPQPDAITLQIGAARSSPASEVRLVLPPVPPRLQPTAIEFLPGVPGVNNPTGLPDRWKWTFAPVPVASRVDIATYYIMSTDRIDPTAGLPDPYEVAGTWYQIVPLTAVSFTDDEAGRTYTAEMPDVFSLPSLRGQALAALAALPPPPPLPAGASASWR